MNKHAQIIDTLRQKGCRLTPQRLLVISVVEAGSGHMGVDDIYQKAKESYPYLDIATVYRTLHLFKELGVMTEVGIKDRLHFELIDPNQRHQHMVCNRCDTAFELTQVHLSGFRNLLAQKLGFQLDLDNFSVSGVCSQCSMY